MYSCSSRSALRSPTCTIGATSEMRRSVHAWLYGESRYSSRMSAFASKANTESSGVRFAYALAAPTATVCSPPSVTTNFLSSINSPTISSVRSAIARGLPLCAATSGIVWIPTRYGSQPIPMSYSSIFAEASMIAAGPSRDPVHPEAVESYGAGNTTTRDRSKPLCSGPSHPKFRWKNRSSVTRSPGERYPGRSSHLEDIPFPFVVRLSNHERLPRRLASIRVSGAARATENFGALRSQDNSNAAREAHQAVLSPRGSSLPVRGEVLDE